jgi:uncharacterized damage-inducible protein DinB
MLAEVALYIRLLRERRAVILETLAGLSADALNWCPLPDATNSLYALAVHALGAERHWIHAVVGGRAVERDRAAEFRARGDDVAALRAQSAAVARTSEEILGQLTEAEMDAPRGAAPNTHPVRWCILHIIEHDNEHLGQMRLTRQLWENRSTRPHEI